MAGIYHNDIKPGNLMNDKDGNTFLVNIDSISFEVRKVCAPAIDYSPCKYFIKIIIIKLIIDIIHLLK